MYTDLRCWSNSKVFEKVYIITWFASNAWKDKVQLTMDTRHFLHVGRSKSKFNFCSLNSTEDVLLVPKMSKPSKSCLVPHRKRLLRRRGVGFDHLTTQSTQNKLGQMGENRISESEKRLTIFTREMTTTSSDSDNVDSPPLIFVKKFKLVYTRNWKPY
jgi:hypothetical protein